MDTDGQGWAWMIVVVWVVGGEYGWVGVRMINGSDLLKYAQFSPLSRIPTHICMTPITTDNFIFIELRNSSSRRMRGDREYGGGRGRGEEGGVVGG